MSGAATISSTAFALEIGDDAVGAEFAGGDQRFVVWCPVASLDGLANNAIAALYYLPQYFSLLLPRSLAIESAKFGMLPFANRIQFYDPQVQDSSQDESLFMDAVLREDVGLSSEFVGSRNDGIPVVAVSGRTASPEGIASALLRTMRG
jgi:hypothetical protein